ncbi:SAGA HAT/Core module component [Maudiozyma exigua]|uniref:SAGA HAT/Core module component n=1 Tax=Maudiozyma exigua TaxID=34358 RepID=A0A9P6WB25_MAUEX|nr:SAGA HAT/Core module component [Kazachstania exigua]
MVENYWRLVISSLQDIYNANEVVQFDDDTMLKRMNFDSLPDDQLQTYLMQFQEHIQNINKASGSLESASKNLAELLEQQRLESQGKENQQPSTGSTSGVPAASPLGKSDPSVSGSNEIDNNGGRQYWISQYNSPEPIIVGSEVAYKPRKSGDGEWFQCEVIKVHSDKIRYEVRDPEPDELGNTGKVFKCSWKELILIPTLKNASIKSKTLNYPPGTKVLARYPETTTFYPAEVIGNKRDGTCRLRFEGEEEVDKETEVPRRLVLPFPMASATPAKK